MEGTDEKKLFLYSFTSPRYPTRQTTATRDKNNNINLKKNTRPFYCIQALYVFYKVLGHGSFV